MVKGRLLKYIGVFGIFTNIAIAFIIVILSHGQCHVYHTLIGTFDGMSQANVAGFFDSYTDVSHSTTGLPKLLFSM
jgi:hypothetical protein